MKKLLVLAFILTGIFYTAKAQDESEDPQKGFDKSKLFFGGNFALNFGNITIVNVSPQVGYRFSRLFAAGAGINGQYSSFRRPRVDGSTYSRENYGVAGLNIFGRVYPIDQILLQVQPEMNYTWGKFKQFNVGEQKLEGKFVPSVLLGAGGVIPTGRGAFLAMVQYDILQNARTPYGNRVFYNFGYNLGF